MPLTTTQQQNLQFGATAPGAVAAYGGTWYGGPPLYPATAYLSQVGIWTQGGGGGGGAAGAGTYYVWATAGTGSPFGAIAKVVSNASFSGGLIGYTIPAGTAVSIDVTPGASSLSISTILATGTGIAQPPAYAATGGAQSLTAGLATGTGRAWAVQAQISGTGIISPVAGQTGTNYTFGANSITLTLPSGITPGNLIVACLVARNAGITVTPPARWAQAGTGAMLSGTLGAQIFCLVATSADAGLTSFTFGYSSSVGQLGTIREWNSTSGWLAAPVDQVSAIPAYNSATVQTGTTGTTAQASELAVAVLAWISDALSESGLTAGYTSGLTVTQNFNSVREAYKILAATGTQACQETISAAENNAGFLATFMPAAGGVSGPNNVTAVLAHGTGTAWPPAYSATGGAQSLTAGLATGTGTAQPVHLQFVAGWIFVGETASATTTGTAFTVNVPAGVQNGDNLILYATGFCAGSFNVPVGWTQIYKQALGMSASHAFLLATRTAASEPASYTVTTTATAQPVVGIYAVRGGTGQVYGSALATRHTAYQSYLSTPGYTKLHNTSLLVFGYGGVNSANTGGSGLVLPSSSPDLLTGSSTADHNNFSGGTDMALLASKVTTGKLTWSPPALGMGGKTVTDLTLIDTGASQSLNLNANTDYRVHLPATGPMTGALFLRGGYNIQIIGGQINLQYPGSDAFNDTMGIYYNRGNPGHIYVEGVLIHAPVPPATASAGGSPPVASTGDGANGDCYPGPVDITWQNIRVENISGCSGGADHADVIQLYNMAGSVGHMDHVTASGNCQGINIDPDYAYQTYGLMPDSYDLRNLNMNTISNPYSGFSNRYMYFLTYHLTGATGMPVSLTNCWAWEPNGIGAQNAVWPDLSTATDGANSVYNSSTGQLSFPNSPEISGVISNGTPPGGDYVPVGTAGPGYVSPGYMSAGEAWIPTPVDSITFVLELAAALPGSQLTAGLAHAVGTAQPPTIAGAVGILAGLANATGAASPLTTGLTAGLASGTGKAWPPFPSINGSQNLVARLASATGIAWPPGIQLTAGLAGGTGAAGAATSRQVISSPALESYGFGTFPQVPPGSAIQSVIATIVQYGSNASVLAPSYQLWNGTSAMIGSAQPGTASTTPGNTDVVSFTGVTYAQLATLRLRVIGSSYTGNTGATLNVDAVSLSVVWLPGVNSVILPLTLAVIPVFPAPVVTATVNAHVFPGVFAAGVPAFPAPSIGVKNATALPSALAVVPAFPAAVASTALSASVTPGVLAVIPAFPAITDVTGENWAASEDIATSGTGSWTNAGNVTGSPDSSTATWTAP